MKKIISVSRRTDIPAFYGDWFMRRLEEGFAGWENPFGRQKIVTSLKPEDVSAFVFWSKNFRPFLPHLNTIRERNIPAIFNYTITGLPHVFECNGIKPDDAVDSLKELSRRYSPEHINWRYDPVIFSDITDERFHLERFRWLADQLKGYVTRCLLSFVTRYGKVERNFKKFGQENRITISDPDIEWRIALADKFADIAQENGIRMYTCCGDYLVADRIMKAHCIDGSLIGRLYPGCSAGKIKPTRPECGCCTSTDIGRYDTCPHGCIYCYANINKERAAQRNIMHDPDSAFLGYAKHEADQFLAEIKTKGTHLMTQHRASDPHA